MPAPVAEDWAKWFKSNKANLAEFVRVLEAGVAASRDAGDSAATFAGPNALAELAHKAGYREGMRAAIGLLTERK